MSHCKTVIITGASGGIGCAIAKHFCTLDFDRIVVCYNHNYPAQAVQAIENAGKICVLFQGDFSVSEAADKLCQSVNQIDLLVHCAGVADYRLLSQTSDADYHKVMSADLDSLFYLMRAASSKLMESKGSVIAISSVWGVCGASCESVYSAAKAAVIGFVKAWAKEYAPMGVRVNAIAPGVIDTQMMADFTPEEKQDIVTEIPLGRMGTGKDIAQGAEFLYKCDYITGQTIIIDGGYIV